MKTTNLPFYITLLEWYEFTIYNLLLPYKIFSGEAGIYRDLLIIAASFLSRPIGAILASRLEDKDSALRLTLFIMTLSTLGMAVGIQGQSGWFVLMKVMQGLAIGGSYGVASLKVYEDEEGKERSRINYLLAKVHTGWAWGMLIGQITVLSIKLLVRSRQELMQTISTGSLKALLLLTPSTQFVSWGWRIPFLLSGLAGTTLLLRTRTGKLLNSLSMLTSNQDAANNTMRDISKYLRKNLLIFICIFSVAMLDMSISHLWNTYSDIAREVNNSQLLTGLIPTLKLIIYIFLFPICGHITDKLNRILGNQQGNYIMLFLVCVSMMLSAKYAPWHSLAQALVCAITCCLCFGSLTSWIIYHIEKPARRYIFGLTVNLVGSTVGGFLPVIAAYTKEIYGIAGLSRLMFALGALSFVSLLYTWRKKSGLRRD